MSESLVAQLDAEDDDNDALQPTDDGDDVDTTTIGKRKSVSSHVDADMVNRKRYARRTVEMQQAHRISCLSLDYSRMRHFYRHVVFLSSLAQQARAAHRAAAADAVVQIHAGGGQR